MTEDCQQVFEQQSEVPTKSEQLDDVMEENDFEFDCPKSFDFKDPNVDDAKANDVVEDFQENNLTSRPRLIRNQTRTKLISKKMANSPIAKRKKPLRPVMYNRKTIASVNERLYNAAKRRRPTYKTMAELVQDFDKKTRVYEDENDKVSNLKRSHVVPRSPKLVCKYRNRSKALSQQEQDELIARANRQNTFKAQPLNKKIFDNYATGILKPQTAKKLTVARSLEPPGFLTSTRVDRRKEKMQAIQQSIENVRPTINNAFKARKMPNFKKVPVVLRNYHLTNTIKKQTSDKCLNKNSEKMTNTVIKQNSDSTLIRIVSTDNHELDKNAVKDVEFIDKYDDNLVDIDLNEEQSNGESKTLTNFENSKECEDNVEDQSENDENKHSLD